MSGAEPIVAAELASEAIPAAAAATTAATAAPAAAGLGSTLSGMGSALTGTALGSTGTLGSGIAAGTGGLGLAAPASFGSLGGLGGLATAPGMSGALGSGIAGMATAAPEVGSMFASSAVPSSFSTPFTVGDAMSKVGNAAQMGQKASSTMNMFQPQQPQRQAPQSRPIFQGDAPSLNPFAQQQPDQNTFQRYLMQRRMNGLLG